MPHASRPLAGLLIAILMVATAAPAAADEIQPYTVPTIAPYQSQSIQPVQSQPIQPVQSQPVQPVQSQSVQPIQSQPVQPMQPDTSRQVTSQSQAAEPGNLDFFFHTYVLDVPGAVWTVENVVDDTITTTIAAGVPDTGQIAVYPDGTYAWNNTWEDRLIVGEWEPTGDAGYPIRLLRAEGDRAWGLGQDTTGYSQEGTGIILWGGQSLADQYRGTLLQ